MKSIYPPEWRTQNRAKRRFYAKYMGWLEKGGFVIVAAIFAGFVYAFNYQVEDVVKADGVTLAAASIEVKAETFVGVGQKSVDDFGTVKKGQKVGQFLEGDSDIRKWQLSGTQESDGIIKLPWKDLIAPSDGVIKWLDAGGEVKEGEPIFKVMDYSKLEVEGALEGQTVAKAKEGQKARLTSLVIPPAASVLFRGSAEGKDLISGQLLGEEVRSLLAESLAGRDLKARDELPMMAGDIKQVQVDANLTWKEGGSEGAAPLDPSSREAFSAEVAEGTHEVTLQTASLPADLKAKVTNRIKQSLQGRSVQLSDGQKKTIESVESVGVIVHLKGSEASQTAAALPASVLNHKFNARLQLIQPPAYLIEAVKRADKEGKAVTARAEVVTGFRPIALLLLKRS